MQQLALKNAVPQGAAVSPGFYIVSDAQLPLFGIHGEMISHTCGCDQARRVEWANHNIKQTSDLSFSLPLSALADSLTN